MTRPEAVLREKVFHRTEIPPVQDLAIVRGLSALVVERDELIAGVKADLRGARRPAWEQKRDALNRIRDWEGRGG